MRAIYICGCQPNWILQQSEFDKYCILSLCPKVKHFDTCSFNVQDERRGSLIGYDQKSTFKSSPWLQIKLSGPFVVMYTIARKVYF